jgi:hypothetical protein
VLRGGSRHQGQRDLSLIGISDALFTSRRSIRVRLSKLRELRQLREENAKLKRLVAELSLESHILHEIVPAFERKGGSENCLWTAQSPATECELLEVVKSVECDNAENHAGCINSVGCTPRPRSASATITQAHPREIKPIAIANPINHRPVQGQ